MLTKPTIESAKILSVSDDGRMGLMERLEPILMLSWNSQKDISHEDMPMLKALAELIKKLIKENRTPYPLSPHLLMLDQHKHLKPMQPLHESAFDFNAIEHFIKEASNSNLTVFTHLMTSSGLSEHGTAKFYFHFISRTLFKETPAADELAAIFESSDSKVVDRATSMAKELKRLEDDIFTQFLIQHQDLDISALKKTLKNVILDYFKQTKTFSFLWPTMKDDILMNLKAKLT
jgi:hypothetical protein